MVLLAKIKPNCTFLWGNKSILPYLYRFLGMLENGCKTKVPQKKWSQSWQEEPLSVWYRTNSRPFHSTHNKGAQRNEDLQKDDWGDENYGSDIIDRLDEVAMETGAKRQVGQSNSRREHSCEDASLSVSTLANRRRSVMNVAEGFGVLRTSWLTKHVRSKWFYSWLAPGITSGAR